MNKIIVIILSLASIACSIQTLPASIEKHDAQPRRDYHALYDRRPIIEAPETDARKAGYE